MGQVQLAANDNGTSRIVQTTTGQVELAAENNVTSNPDYS